jgi:hypothetical protein
MPGCFKEAPDEGRIVSDDQIGGGRQRGHGLVVELPAKQLIVGDAGKPHDLLG